MDVAEYRAGLSEIRTEAAARLTDAFPALEFKALDDSSPRWVLMTERIVEDAHGKALTLTRDAYTSMRRAAGHAGEVAFVLPAPDKGKLRASMLYLGPFSAKRALSGGARIPDAAETVYSNTTARALLEAMSGARGSMRATSLRDPAAQGWRRFANAGACRFCRMLADRGAVYRRETAFFAAHLHCGCSAGPVFVGAAPAPEANAIQYLASRRGNTEKERASVRAYLDAFYPGR